MRTRRVEDRLHAYPRATSAWMRSPRRQGRKTPEEWRFTMTEDRAAAEADVVTKLSRESVAGTVARLTGMITAKGMRLFAVIDQAAEARQVGLTLRETGLVIFGSPRRARR